MTGMLLSYERGFLRGLGALSLQNKLKGGINYEMVVAVWMFSHRLE